MKNYQVLDMIDVCPVQSLLSGLSFSYFSMKIKKKENKLFMALIHEVIIKEIVCCLGIE